MIFSFPDGKPQIISLGAVDVGRGVAIGRNAITPTAPHESRGNVYRS